MFLLRFGVGTSWLVTTQRIFISFRSLFFKARLFGKGGPTGLLDYLHGHIDGVQLARFL